LPQVKWWQCDGSNARIIDCHKYNDGIVMGLMDRLLIATRKRVAMWSNGQIIDCHKYNGGIVMGLMSILLIATSKMVVLRWV
jgi:hypothetical protein